MENPIWDTAFESVRTRHCIDAVVCDISPNRDYTQSLLYQLADYEVYPVHLQDVVSEMIG